jgi:hypothetical protein
MAEPVFAEGHWDQCPERIGTIIICNLVSGHDGEQHIDFHLDITWERRH